MADLRDFTGAAADLLFGSSCVGCRRAGPALCLRCRSVLEQVPFVAWPSPRPAGLPRPFAVTEYDGAAKAAVVSHKEHAVLALAKPLGRALSLSVMANLAAATSAGLTSPTVVAMVPPPSAAATVRERGHDPLQRILDACTKALRMAGVAAVPAPVLERRREVADQAGLSAQDRSANLGGAFEVRPRSVARVAGRPVLVVDDVLTTGATAAEVARALGAADADILGVAVIAATRRRCGPTAGSDADVVNADGYRLGFDHGTRPGPWLRQPGLEGSRPSLASRCQPQAKRPT